MHAGSGACSTVHLQAQGVPVAAMGDATQGHQHITPAQAAQCVTLYQPTCSTVRSLASRRLYLRSSLTQASISSLIDS